MVRHPQNVLEKVLEMTSILIGAKCDDALFVQIFAKRFLLGDRPVSFLGVEERREEKTAYGYTRVC